MSGVRAEVLTPLRLISRPLDDRTIVYCTGSIRFGDETDALRELVRELLAKYRTIVLDLAGVNTMDSGAIGTLVGLAFSARNAGAAIKVARPSARIRTLFQLTRLNAVLDIVDTLEPAAAAGGTP